MAVCIYNVPVLCMCRYKDGGGVLVLLTGSQSVGFKNTYAERFAKRGWVRGWASHVLALYVNTHSSAVLPSYIVTASYMLCLSSTCKYNLLVLTRTTVQCIVLIE